MSESEKFLDELDWFADESDTSTKSSEMLLVEIMDAMLVPFWAHLDESSEALERLRQSIESKVSPARRKDLQLLAEGNAHNEKYLVQLTAFLFFYTSLMGLNPEKLDLNQFLQDVGNSFLEEHQNQVILNFDFKSSEPFYVLFDRDLLTQALLELLENAWYYSEKPSEITISTAIEEGVVVIAIEDRGIGVDPLEESLILKPFTRGSNASKYHPRGVGLGLIKAKLVAEKHGGSFECHSGTVGTIMTIRLPDHPDEEENEFIFGTESKKILLYQEEEADLQLYLTLLKDNYYEVKTINTPDEWHQVTQGWKPDLVLMDSHYQGQLTIPLLQELLQHFPDGSTPCLVLTNVEDPNIELDFFNEGTQGYVVKPVDTEQFVMLINHLLRIPLNL